MSIFDKPNADRPKVSLRMTSLEMAVEAIALAGIAVNLLLFVVYWPKLPDTAVAAGAGVSRSTMFMLVTLLPFVVYISTTAMGFFPRLFSYPVKITTENAAREYGLAAGLLRVVKAEVVVGMLIVEWVFINISMGEDMTLSPPFMILFFGLLVLTILYFVYEMYKQK